MKVNHPIQYEAFLTDYEAEKIEEAIEVLKGVRDTLDKYACKAVKDDNDGSVHRGTIVEIIKCLEGIINMTYIE